MPITMKMPAPYNKRGECSVCGAPAYDGRATKCDEHRTGPRPKATTVRPPEGIRIVMPDDPSKGAPTVPPSTPSATTKQDPKQARVDALKASIADDLNPGLVKGFAFICRPVPAANFYTEPPTTPKFVVQQLGERIVFNEMERDILAHAAVEMESTPFATMAKGAAAPWLPYGWMIAGLGVVAWHVYGMLNFREQIMVQWSQQNQENAANTAQAPPPDAAPMPEAGAEDAPVETPGAILGVVPGEFDVA